MESIPSTWINCTGVTLNLYDAATHTISSLPPVSNAHTARTTSIMTTTIGSADVQLAAHVFVGDTGGLPDQSAGTGLIVTPTVAQALLASRDDLWVPSDLLPDTAEGAITCRSLIRAT